MISALPQRFSQARAVMPFITTRTVLFGDCDPAGIVYTPRIAYFVIEAIHEFLSDRLGGEGLRLLEPDGFWASYDVIDVWYQKA